MNEILTAVLDTLAERGKDYGSPLKNHQDIADHWSSTLGVEVSPLQVIQCMIGLKLARLNNSPTHEDSWRDIIGYAALGHTIAEDME